jgi:hypothetical protein
MIKNQNNVALTKRALTSASFLFALLLALGAACTEKTEEKGLPFVDPRDQNVGPIELFEITVTKPKEDNVFKTPGTPSKFGNSEILWGADKTEKDATINRAKDYDPYMGTYCLGKTPIGTISSVEVNSELLDDEGEKGMSLKVKLDKKKNNFLEYEVVLSNALNLDKITGSVFERNKKRQEAIEAAFKNFLENYTLYISNTVTDGTGKTVKCDELKVRAKEQDEEGGKKKVLNIFEKSKVEDVNTEDFALEPKHLKIIKDKDLKFFVKIEAAKNARDGKSFGLLMVKKDGTVVLSKKVCYKQQ